MDQPFSPPAPPPPPPLGGQNGLVYGAKRNSACPLILQVRNALQYKTVNEFHCDATMLPSIYTTE
jgi:hypothetical protein